MFLQLQAHTLYFLPNCIHTCSFRCSPSHLFLVFCSLLSKKDGYGANAAFVPSRFENLLSRTSYFSTVFKSKHKICSLIFPVDDQRFLQYRNYYFHMPNKVGGEGFLSQMLDQNFKLLQMRRRVSNSQGCGNSSL